MNEHSNISTCETSSASLQDMNPVDVHCEEFAAVLGLDEPVPVDVLRAATHDEKYAARLLGARRNPAALDFLLSHPPKPNTVAPQSYSNVELVRKAAVALIRWGKTGFAFVDEVQLKKRRDACLDCANLTDPPDKAVYKLAAGANSKKICSICGCNVWAKTRIPSEACPQAHPNIQGVSNWEEPMSSSALDEQ